MLNRIVKPLAAAAILAMGLGLAMPATAIAAGSGTVSENLQLAGWEKGYRHDDRRWRGDRRWHDGRRHDRRHGGYRDYRPYHPRGFCSPREAVHKAMRAGLRHPGIHRVSHRAIVVTGYHWGHRATLVFDRNSPRCRIIGGRGI